MTQAFETEKPKLMALPMDGYPVDARLEVSVAKTPYVRFVGRLKAEG